METTLLELKTSLSLTLRYFFPFAGNLVLPPPPRVPYILYTEGDSVSFIVNESTSDFSHLVGDRARQSREFQALLPILPPAIASKSSTGCMQRPVMAIQVTVFPNVGISLGVVFSHVAADGRTLAHFMKSWSLVQKCRGNLACLQNSLPCFNREYLTNYPLGHLSSLFMNDDGIFEANTSSAPNTFIDNIRITCKVKRSQVELLKVWVKKQCMEVNGSEPVRMSTFVVTCAYMWVCLIKLQQSRTHDQQHLPSTDSDALSLFHFPVDCREYLKLPATYFGNCIISHLPAAKKSELLGQNGIVVAATAIGREIMEFQKHPFKDAQDSLPKIIEKHRIGKDLIFATSSPRFEVYKTDFGWGRPKKTEVANIVSLGSLFMFSIAESNDDEGGVEIGVALATDDFDSFNSVFEDGLSKLL